MTSLPECPSGWFRDNFFAVWARDPVTGMPIPTTACNGSWAVFGLLAGALTLLRIGMVISSVLIFVRIRSRARDAGFKRKRKYPIAPILDAIHTCFLIPAIALPAAGVVSGTNGSALPLPGICVGLFMLSSMLFTVKVVHVNRRILPTMAMNSRNRDSKRALEVPEEGSSSAIGASQHSVHGQSAGAPRLSALRAAPSTPPGVFKSNRIRDDPLLMSLFICAFVCNVVFVMGMLVAPAFPESGTPMAVAFYCLSLSAFLLQATVVRESYAASRDLRDHVAAQKDSQKQRSQGMLKVAHRLRVVGVFTGCFMVITTGAMLSVAAGWLPLSYIASMLMLYIPSIFGVPGYYLFWRKKQKRLNAKATPNDQVSPPRSKETSKRSKEADGAVVVVEDLSHNGTTA